MTASSVELTGTTLHSGVASGVVLELDGPLSFWGGVDESGRIVDRHHPQFGASVRKRVLAMTSGRGSSSSANVLAELVRTRNGPAGIVMTEPDAIVTLGAIVASELYEIAMPIVVLSSREYARLSDNALISIDASESTAKLTQPPQSFR